MNWALKRQILYASIALAIVVFFGYLIIAPYFNKEPTCMDGKQNGDETGVDCGGSCLIACTIELDQISILWARSFRVVEGRYNAVAYLTNHNPTTAIDKIKYRFRFADENNIYIGKREGETFIPPGRNFAIFEPAIDLGNSIPIYTSFEFIEEPTWLQVSPELIKQVKISVSDIKAETFETTPKVFAIIRNESLFRIPEVSFVIMLYDSLGNVINVSHTYIEFLTKEAKADLSFTWPEPITSEIVFREIIPMFNIFSVRLK